MRRALDARGVEAKLNLGSFALVSVVGEALRQHLDLWDERARRALADAKVEIHGCSRDDISLSYLVPEGERTKAVTRLHRALVG